MRKIRVSVMDEDTAELLDEAFFEVGEQTTELSVCDGSIANRELATLVIGKR